MTYSRTALLLAAALVIALAGCATVPVGTTSAAMIGHGKTQSEYVMADQQCRQFAATATAPAADAANTGAAGGALLGAGSGAALGAIAGGGRGAGIGAAAGLAAMLLMGAAQAGANQVALQQHYDAAYTTCMCNLGHQVPGKCIQARPVSAPVPPPPPGRPLSVVPPGPPPSYQQSSPPPSAAAPCEPSGRYVRTPQGFVAECK